MSSMLGKNEAMHNNAVTYCHTNVVHKFIAFANTVVDSDIEDPKCKNSSSDVSPYLIKIYQMAYQLVIVSRVQKKNMRRMSTASVVKVRVLR
jgi:hypothetical protein